MFHKQGHVSCNYSSLKHEHSFSTPKSLLESKSESLGHTRTLWTHNVRIIKY